MPRIKQTFFSETGYNKVSWTEAEQRRQGVLHVRRRGPTSQRCTWGAVVFISHDDEECWLTVDRRGTRTSCLATLLNCVDSPAQASPRLQPPRPHCRHRPPSTSHIDDQKFTVSLPALPSFPIHNLPSFLTITSDDDPLSFELAAFLELFEMLGREAVRGRGPRMLVNNYDALESDYPSAVPNLDKKTIGPVLFAVVHGWREGQWNPHR